MSTALTTLSTQLAQRLGLNVAGEELMNTLKQTAFKGPATDAQLQALLIVANQYGLNPWTKEIYAFPDKNNGIVPVVGVDGWARIMNDNPQMDGIEFRYSEETITHKKKTAHVWIEAIVTRKDRAKPIVVREYFDEVVRDANFATPWDSHPKRMHRHKAAIQAARLAFGFGGLMDEDEAERTREKDITPQSEVVTKPIELEPYPADKFEANLPEWQGLIDSGRRSAGDIIATIKTRFTLSDEQETRLRACGEEQGAVYENA
jgi:phage recombination protein Bet